MKYYKRTYFVTKLNILHIASAFHTFFHTSVVLLPAPSFFYNLIYVYMPVCLRACAFCVCVCVCMVIIYSHLHYAHDETRPRKNICLCMYMRRYVYVSLCECGCLNLWYVTFRHIYRFRYIFPLRRNMHIFVWAWGFSD